MNALKVLEDRVIDCRACPRLVEWRERVAREKRAAYRDHDYWGRPVPGFGDPRARLLIVGLAPAAHGANRTGRMFTGDRSGEWLYSALHRAGFASRAESVSRDDGLQLKGAFVTAAVRCAPPANKPNPDERDRCQAFLEEELDHFLPRLRCVVGLGKFAFDQTVRIFRDRGIEVPRPMPRFGHGVEVALPYDESPLVRSSVHGSPPGATLDARGITLLASYHPSQQNTFTGKLTREAFDQVWTRARDLSGRS